MNTLSHHEFIQTFPSFSKAPEYLVTDILSKSVLQLFPAGKFIYSGGDTCSSIAFLLSGEIRVYKTSERGREITLYEIGKGETCILNASCILANTPYPANAATVKDGAMLLIPADDFGKLMNTSEALRHFVFDIMSKRLAVVMALVEEVAFGKMDLRLREYLIEKAENGVLRSTHQKIADDLGTSREVVSRLLKDLKRKEFVVISRNKIVLLIP